MPSALRATVGVRDLNRESPITTSDPIVCSTPVARSSAPGRVRIEAAISTPKGPPTLWFDVPEDAVTSTALGDPFAVSLWLPAMRSDRTLVVEGAVSRSLLSNIGELQAVYSMWFPEFSRVAVEPNEIVPDVARADGNGLFFSGGVDSFYSLLTRDPTHLIYVDMLDTLNEDEVLRTRIRSSIEQVATASSTRLLTVSTNLRAVLDSFTDWALHSHSTALGAIAHTLTGVLGSCVVAGDRTYDRMIPFGAHPLTIPMLGSGRLPIRTSGWDIWRVDRVARITGSELAMKHLRVCWENRDSAFNCARCSKCLRTMSDLVVWDALEKCETFPDTLDLEALAAMEMSAPFLDYWVPTMHRARETSHDDLADAIGVAVERVLRQETSNETAPATGVFAPIATDLEEAVELHHEAMYQALSRFSGRWLLGRVLRDLPGKVVAKLRHLLRRIGRGNRQ